MIVSVQFHGVQRRLTQIDKIQITVLENECVSDVLSFLKSYYPYLSISEKEVLVTVNNNLSTMNHILSPNDKIAFLPHIGGG